MDDALDQTAQQPTSSAGAEASTILQTSQRLTVATSLPITTPSNVSRNTNFQHTTYGKFLPEAPRVDFAKRLQQPVQRHTTRRKLATNTDTNADTNATPPSRPLQSLRRVRRHSSTDGGSRLPTRAHTRTHTHDHTHTRSHTKTINQTRARASERQRDLRLLATPAGPSCVALVSSEQLATAGSSFNAKYTNKSTYSSHYNSPVQPAQEIGWLVECESLVDAYNKK
jgi:hypothetical protein